MLSIAFLTTDLPNTFLEKLGYGGKMLLVGMGTVFSVLAILWLSLELMRVFFYDLPRKRKAAKEEASATEAEPVTVSAPASAGEDEEELVAVLAAAVAAAQSEAPQLRFRAVSFKRIH